MGTQRVLAPPKLGIPQSLSYSLPMRQAGEQAAEPDATGASGAFTSRADRLGYCPPLDGIRGGAMIMVLLAHLSYKDFASFAVAVDMFFVISGFLITTLILEEYGRNDRIDVKEFYLRRAFRLFPMLYATLAATLVGALLVGGDQLIEDTVSDVKAAGLYVYHVVHPVGIEILTGDFPHHRPLIQLWSLSVEEHFYLVAAALSIIVIRYRLPRLLIAGCLGIWAFIGAARLLGHVGPRLAWYQRPDSLLLGVALAYIHALMPTQLTDRANLRLRRVALAALAVLVAVIGIGTVFAKPFDVFVSFSPFDGGSLTDRMYWGRFGFTVCNVCIAVIVLAMVRNREWWLSKAVSWKVFRAIGVRSYCIYLIHVPLAVLMFEQWGTRDENGELIPAGGAIIAYLILLPVLSELAHRYIEQPAMRLRKRKKVATV